MTIETKCQIGDNIYYVDRKNGGFTCAHIHTIRVEETTNVFDGGTYHTVEYVVNGMDCIREAEAHLTIESLIEQEVDKLNRYRERLAAIERPHPAPCPA